MADLVKTRKLHHGLPSQEERVKFKQEVVVGRDGIYLSYLSDFFDIVYRTEKFDSKTEEVLEGVGVPEVEAGLTVASKIPSGTIYRMVAWYRHVEKLYGTEATMQVFYDKTEGEKDFPQELKDKYEGAIVREGKFVYVVPEQNVTGGHVTFDGNQFPTQMTKELYDWAISNYEPVLNIHSHNHMSAFWSGEDDANELPLYTRLCLVIGKVDTNHPQFRFSWNFEGKRHHFEDKIDTFIEPIEIVSSIKGLDYAETQEMGFDDALGYINFDTLSFDAKWDDRIKARGKYGSSFNKYETLAKLEKSQYAMTDKELEIVEDLVVNGDYKDGEHPDDERFESDDEEKLQDEFFGDLTEQVALELEDESEIFAEKWKKDLHAHGKNLEQGDSAEDSGVSGVVGDANTFRQSTRFPNTTSPSYPGNKSGKKSEKFYEKFKKEQLRKDKHIYGKSDKTGNTKDWDDFGGQFKNKK